MSITKREAKALIRYITTLEGWTQNEYDTSKYFTTNASNGFDKLLKISKGETNERPNISKS